MRYGKKHVNEIINRILKAAEDTGLGVENNFKFGKELELIKEEFMLVDRRVSSLPEYTSNIVRDFVEFKLSYKDIMEKYHCSQRNLRGLLMDCADGDDRVWKEIVSRRKN